MQWNETILSQMSSRARHETIGARDWLLNHQNLASPFMHAITTTHPAIWVGEVFESIAGEIANQNPIAIELGCLFIIEDPKSPFGRIMKRKVLNALRRNSKLIQNQYERPLRAAFERMQGLPYPPQELKDFARLIRVLAT